MLCCCMGCRYVDHFIYKQQLCIVTDYCEHGDIHNYLQTHTQQCKTPLPEGQVCAPTGSRMKQGLS